MMFIAIFLAFGVNGKILDGGIYGKNLDHVVPRLGQQTEPIDHNSYGCYLDPYCPTGCRIRQDYDDHDRMTGCCPESHIMPNDDMYKINCCEYLTFHEDGVLKCEKRYECHEGYSSSWGWEFDRPRGSARGQILWESSSVKITQKQCRMMCELYKESLGAYNWMDGGRDGKGSCRCYPVATARDVVITGHGWKFCKKIDLVEEVEVVDNAPEVKADSVEEVSVDIARPGAGQTGRAEHECLWGEQWCEATQKCQRFWIEPCSTSVQRLPEESLEEKPDELQDADLESVILEYDPDFDCNAYSYGCQACMNNWGCSYVWGANLCVKDGSPEFERHKWSIVVHCHNTDEPTTEPTGEGIGDCAYYDEDGCWKCLDRIGCVWINDFDGYVRKNCVPSVSEAGKHHPKAIYDRKNCVELEKDEDN